MPVHSFRPPCRYAADDTPNAHYLNTHHVINNLRQEARASGGQGPRVLVVGPMDSGKSSMCKLLLNWAVRAGWQPTYVDLDVGAWKSGVEGDTRGCPVWLGTAHSCVEVGNAVV